MCILKDGSSLLVAAKYLQTHTMTQIDSGDSSDGYSKMALQQKQLIQNECFVCPCPQKCMGFTWNPTQMHLIQLYSKLNSNFLIIENLSKQIEFVQDKINGMSPQKCESETKIPEKQIPQQKIPKLQKKQSIQFYGKLFPNLSQIQPQNQEYKLQMIGPPTTKLYKGRHFNLKVKLISKYGGKDIVKNGNIINLCIGVFDNEGNWITQNKTGQSIFKGKTETQLYNGQANFQKINIRQVSSCYADQRVNLAVYAVPSSVQYENTGNKCQHIEWENISPLIIKNIKVLARKKSTSDNWVIY